MHTLKKLTLTRSFQTQRITQKLLALVCTDTLRKQHRLILLKCYSIWICDYQKYKVTWLSSFVGRQFIVIMCRQTVCHNHVTTDRICHLFLIISVSVNALFHAIVTPAWVKLPQTKLSACWRIWTSRDSLMDFPCDNERLFYNQAM